MLQFATKLQKCIRMGKPYSKLSFGEVSDILFYGSARSYPLNLFCLKIDSLRSINNFSVIKLRH